MRCAVRARSLAWATLVQSLLVLVLLTGVFFVARPLIPFARTLPAGPLLGVALLWGALAVTRSPSATLGILSQTRARGPLVDVHARLRDDVRPRRRRPARARARLRPAPRRPVGELRHGVARACSATSCFGSVALGTTLGLFIAAYLRLVNRQMLVVLLLLGFAVSNVLDYLQFDSLLTFMVAGFIVRNMSNQGQKFVPVHRADGDRRLRRVLRDRRGGPGRPAAAPALACRAAAGRVACGVTWVGARLSGRLADDPPLLRRWGWSGMVSQAGLALGLAVLVEREFPIRRHGLPRARHRLGGHQSDGRARALQAGPRPGRRDLEGPRAVVPIDAAAADAGMRSGPPGPIQARRTCPMDMSQPSSVIFSLRGLERMEEERVRAQALESDRAREARERARHEAQDRARLEREQRERIEAEARREVEHRAAEEAARIEAIHWASIEGARAYAEAKARADERERMRMHELEIERARALAPRGGVRSLAVSALFGMAVSAGIAMAVHFGVVGPRDRARVAEARRQVASRDVEIEELRSHAGAADVRVRALADELSASQSENARLRSALDAVRHPGPAAPTGHGPGVGPRHDMPGLDGFTSCPPGSQDPLCLH